MIGLILAAGASSRLSKDLNEKCCKSLLKINGKMIIEYALDNFAALNLRKVIIVTGDNHSLISTALGDRYGEMEISYVLQSKRVGIVNAIYSAVLCIGNNDIVVSLADEVFLGFKGEKSLENFEKKSDFLCGVTYENNQERIKQNYSVNLTQTDKISCCTEKPTYITNNIKGTGWCVFSKQCIEFLLDNYNLHNNYPCELCDYINELINHGFIGRVFHIADEEINVNRLSDYEYAKNQLEV